MPSSLSVWNWNELIRLNPNSEMCGLWAGLVLAGVSPFMPCSSCSQIERSLLLFFFFFLSTNPSPALLLREESPLICYIWQSDRNKFTNRKKAGLRTQHGWPKKNAGSGYVLEPIARSPLGIFFQAMISNLCHQKSVKKVKKCKKVKLKAFFFSRWSNRRRLPSLLDRRSQRSRSSLIEPWFGGLLRLSLGQSPALSFFQEMLS